MRRKEREEKKLRLVTRSLGTGRAYERTAVPDHLPKTHKNQKLGMARA